MQAPNICVSAKSRTYRTMSYSPHKDWVRLIKKTFSVRCAELNSVFGKKIGAEICSLSVWMWVILYSIEAILIFCLCFYYLTSSNSDVPFFDRFFELRNSWISNAYGHKVCVWALLGFLYGCLPTVWIFLYLPNLGIEKETAIRTIMLFAPIALYSSFLLDMLAKDEYYNSTWVNILCMVTAFIGKLLSFFVTLVIGFQLIAEVTYTFQHYDWVKDNFMSMLVAVMESILLMSIVMQVWLFAIVRYLFRPFHNYEIILLTVAIIICLFIICIDFIDEHYTGLTYLFGLISTCGAAFAMFGISASRIKHSRCPRCHTLRVGTTGVADGGISVEYVKDSRSISNYSITSRHSGAEVTDAEEYGLRRNVYHNWHTGHCCHQCGLDWDVAERKMIGSSFIAMGERWVEKYFD